MLHTGRCPTARPAPLLPPHHPGERFPRGLLPAPCPGRGSGRREGSAGGRGTRQKAEGRPPPPHSERHGGLSGERAAGGKQRGLSPAWVASLPRRGSPGPSGPPHAGPAEPREGPEPRPGPAGRQGEHERQPGGSRGQRGFPLPAAAAAGAARETPRSRSQAARTARRGSQGCGRYHRPLLSRRRSALGGGSGTHRPPAPGSRKRRSAGSQRPPPPLPAQRRAGAGGTGRRGSSRRWCRMPALRHPGAAAAWTPRGARAIGEQRRLLLCAPGRCRGAAMGRRVVGQSGGTVPVPSRRAGAGGHPSVPGLSRGPRAWRAGTCMCRSDHPHPAPRLENSGSLSAARPGRRGGAGAGPAPPRGRGRFPRAHGRGAARGPRERLVAGEVSAQAAFLRRC